MPRVRSNTDEEGFSLVEIIIAFAIFLIIIPGAVALLWNNKISIIDNGHRREALLIVQGTLTSLRNQSLMDFSAIKNYSTNDSIYKTAVTITDLDVYTKQAVVTASWQAIPARLQQVSLNTLLVDTQSAMNGNTCLAVPSSQTQPVIDSVLHFEEGNELTGIAVRNNIAYVTANAAAAVAEDFFVIDVTNSAQPNVLAKLNTGPGLSSVAVTNSFAYVGNTSINGQLQIIDIRNPQQPFLTATYKLPGVYGDNTTIASAIAYSEDKIYLGTPKSQIAELHTIDVSDATAPKELGSFEVNAGINAITVVNKVAYIAIPAAEELKAIDVSDSSGLRQIGGFDAPGGSGNGKSLAAISNTLFLGRTVGGKELYALNISNIPTLEALGSRDLNTSIVGIAAVPSWLFMATTDLQKSLQIWNIVGFDAPYLAKSIGLNGGASGMACGRNKLYVIATNVLTIISP